MTRFTRIFWLSVIATLTLPGGFVIAQQMPAVDGRYFPINQMTPPGTTIQWGAKAGVYCPDYFQPIRVTLPTTGTVTYFEGTPDRTISLPAPAQASLLVGRMYRLKVSDVPEFPNVEFYPSIELVDRLHPPAGKVEEYPVEFEFTVEELEWAAAGQLVTKVVYLEQPNRVPVMILDAKQRIKTVEPSQNALAEADLLGRPMAIVRLGGRTPDPNRPEPAFFGPGGPIRLASDNAQAHRNRHPEGSTPRQAGVFKVGPSTSKLAQR